MILHAAMLLRADRCFNHGQCRIARGRAIQYFHRRHAFFPNANAEFFCYAC